MGCREIRDLDLDLDAGFNECLGRFHQPLVSRVPTQETGEEPHIGALACMGGCQRTMPVEFDQHRFDAGIHEITSHAANTQRCGAVGGWKGRALPVQ